jgi:adenylate cyclase
VPLGWHRQLSAMRSWSSLAFREPRSDHAQSAIEMAMAMQCHLETMWAEHPELRLRIGIRTGPVVAGVIGEDKFT